MFRQKSDNGWELCVLANGHLSCDNSNLSHDDVNVVERILAPKYGDLMKKEHITVGYDNWSGVFIMQTPGTYAKCSDAAIKRIYFFLSDYNM